MYGTLKRGFNYHKHYALDENAKFLGSVVLKGARLYKQRPNYPLPFVVMTGDDNDHVMGELFEFTNDVTERMIYSMETYSGYEPVEVSIGEHKATVFTWDEPWPESVLIESGNWEEGRVKEG
jgi:gamma-glutamylcyclotransferase (GGCT)/AIG2-like uncharacterized protein YtfP